MAERDEAVRVERHGWEVRIESAEARPVNGEAAVVEITVRAINTGKSAQSLGPNRFKLRDAEGRSWTDRGYEVAGGWVLLGLEKVQPGLSTEVNLVFEVPRSAHGLWLETIGGEGIHLGELTAVASQTE